MDLSWLRGRAREIIRAGTIPNRPPDRIWGGPGSGADCKICGNPVPRDEPEFELEYFPTGAQSAVAHHMHIQCLEAWESERKLSNPTLSGAPDSGTIGG